MMGRNRNAGKPGAKNPGKTFKRIMAEIMGRYKLHCVAVVICLIVLSLNLLGDGLRDAFDPKLKR